MINDPLETRPSDVLPKIWKNRHLVSAKLTPVNHRIFHAYCKQNNFNYSSGINHLIATNLKENNV